MESDAHRMGVNSSRAQTTKTVPQWNIQVASDMIRILEMMTRKRAPTKPTQQTKCVATQTEDWRMRGIPREKAANSRAGDVMGSIAQTQQQLGR